MTQEQEMTLIQRNKELESQNFLYTIMDERTWRITQFQQKQEEIELLKQMNELLKQVIGEEKTSSKEDSENEEKEKDYDDEDEDEEEEEEDEDDDVKYEKKRGRPKLK